MKKLVLMLFGIASVLNFSFGDHVSFCRKQSQIFNKASSDIGKAATNGGDLCGSLVKFLEAAQDTNATCYDLNVDMKDSAVQGAWGQVKDIALNTCPGANVPTECSNDVVLRWMDDCAQLVNSVQIGHSQRDMCMLSEDYIECVGQITVMCSGSGSLVRGNVYAAIDSARSAMRAFCPNVNLDDIMQGDSPSGGSPLAPATSRQCASSTVNEEIDLCTHNYLIATKDSMYEICRALHSELICIDRIQINCPSFHYNGYETRMNTYETTCAEAYLKCPRDVEDGTHTMSAYCLNKIGNISENSSNYCGKMTDLSNCLSGLRDFCPVTHDNERQEIDQLSSGVDEGLSIYCS